MNRESSVLSASPNRIAPRSGAAAMILLGVIVGFALAVRVSLGVHYDGLDDMGYLDAARRIAQGMGTAGLGALFELRVGMAYPMGWLLRAGWVQPEDFRWLTLAAEMISLLCLFAVGRRTLGERAGFIAACLYAIYPLAIAQASRFDPVPFQVASVSVCLLFLTHAEGSRVRTIASGVLAGVALGLGYLVKEDVALVVPALALIVFLLRAAPRATAVSMCAGAAIVFGVESLAYWWREGMLLYRLRGTSGAGASVAGVQMGAIWDSLSYARTLLGMPYQVGLFWWVAIPAAVAAFRSPSRWLRVFVCTFIAVGAYLQFGSNSLTSYLPLPRTPRYTAIVTPFLILVLAGWLSALASTRRGLALWLAGLLFITAIPCVAYAAISGSERRRNTMAVVPVIRELRLHSAKPVIYTDYYSARSLTLLLDSRYGVRPLFHADYAAARTKMLAPLESLGGGYVLVDRQSSKIYTSTYEYSLPTEIDHPPASWRPIWTSEAYSPDDLDRQLVDQLRRVNARLPDNVMSRRVERNLADMVDGGTATLYYIPDSD